MQSSNAYPWYTEVSAEKPLEQGDFILKCQIVKLSNENFKKDQPINADVAEYDVIVMSQSCDLLGDKIELALVCPFHTLVELGGVHPEYKKDKMKEKLRQSHIVGFHLLNKLNINGDDDYLVVDFKHVHAIPVSLLRKIAKVRGERKRLLPPYREHLSQAFARFFMRVGLPTDIPKFK